MSVTVSETSTARSSPAFATGGSGALVVDVVEVVGDVDMVVVLLEVDVGGGVVSGSRTGVVVRATSALAVGRPPVATDSPPPERATKTITPAISTTAAARPSPIRYFGCVGPGLGGAGAGTSGGPKGAVTTPTVAAPVSPVPARSTSTSASGERAAEQVE